MCAVINHQHAEQGQVLVCLTYRVTRLGGIKDASTSVQM
jgi:hypothetical protein